jgi:hypothetical protein
MKLLGSVHDVGRLTSRQRDKMFRVMDGNYMNMERSRFDRDLAAKRWVILVHTADMRALVGFSTQTMLDAQIGGQRVCALYSGDTVVGREHWGDPALACAWGNFALRLIDKFAGEPLYWFLTSKGFRTYRYLPLFFRSYFPRMEAATPSFESSIIDALGQQIGGHSYDAARQTIRATDDKDYVKPEFSQPGRRSTTDRHVRFFVEHNPGFARGDEMCCLARLSRENFTRAAYRVIAAQRQLLTVG